MDATPYVLLYGTSALTSIAMSVYGWRLWRHRGAGQFALLMLALAFWSACHALSVGASTYEGTLFWSQIQYGGIVSIGPLYLLFALAYADYWEHAPPLFWGGIFVIPVLAYFAVLTNAFHFLWWSSVAPDPTRPFMSLHVVRGPLFWMHAVYSYACLLLGMGLFAQAWKAAPAPYKGQSRLFLIGSIIPLLGNVIHLIGLRLTIVDDPTPFLFLASGLFTCYAAWRFKLLDLVPIAQREVFASMPDGMVVLDEQGRVAEINELATALFAVRHPRWIGQPLKLLIHDSPLAADLRELLDGPAMARSCHINYDGDDGPRGVEVRVRPLRVAQHHAPTGTLIVLRDTSERVRMEQALDRRFTELTVINRVARAVNVAFLTDDVIRPIVREIGRVFAWERVGLALLQSDGASLRVVVDQTLGTESALEGHIATAIDFGPVLEAMHEGRMRLFNTDDPNLAATPTVTVMRELGLQAGLVVPLYSQERPLGVFFAACADKTRITPDVVRLAETIGELLTEALVRTRLYDEAHQASRLKSAFLATVSHELRTPLTSIIGYADMLRRGLYGPLPEPYQAPVEFIRHSGHTLLRLINDILDFSKMEAGRFTIDLYPVDLLSVVEYVAIAIRPQANERGLTLEIELPPGLPRVQSNSMRLEQVLTNLLANAVKFTEHGTITVQAVVCGDRVRVSVKDTGIGIEAAHADAIFQEFRQLENSHTRRYGGTGLGLAISRRLVELMGGTLSLESVPGVGSTFHCDLIIAIQDLEREANG